MSTKHGLEVGDRFDFGSYAFSAEEIRAFADQFDPQDFHTDAEAGTKSYLGGLCASGWHTATALMRLQADYFAETAPRLRFGPSPGFGHLKWIKPVFAGDRITYTGRVVAKRPHPSDPGWALLAIKYVGTNQHGKPVFEMTGQVPVADQM